MNNRLAKHIVQQAIQAGVQEFCVAPGKRNAPLVYTLAHTPGLKVYYWPEERSAAFFALGRARAAGRPVAVITTSGTAAAHLLPAAMEAYYTHVPLLLITADRPRNLRGTGAPQCAEQVGLFSYYARFMQDIALTEECRLSKWTLNGPAHLNVCFDEPKEEECQILCQDNGIHPNVIPQYRQFSPWSLQEFEKFLKVVQYPLVLVGALNEAEKEKIARFLIRLKAPVYLEGPSGLREDERLAAWRVSIDQIWQRSNQAAYPIDGVLRIGSIPTARIWRDLDEKKNKIKVCSISDLPFSGLSWTDEIFAPLGEFFEKAQSLHLNKTYPCEKWLKQEKELALKLIELFEEEPQAEASLVHYLSKRIPKKSLVYLGNSLPVREWDQAATWEDKQFKVAVSRGLCGIDGQISTFLGLSQASGENWALIGDLTALFDMVGPWILPQLPGLNVNVVVINNGGGQIFSRMFSHPAFLNEHALEFGPLAQFWKWNYEKWHQVPAGIQTNKGGRLIEIVPDFEATQRFLSKVKKLGCL